MGENGAFFRFLRPLRRAGGGRGSGEVVAVVVVVERVVWG